MRVTVGQRLRRCVTEAWLPSLKTIRLLLAITVPVSFLVFLMKQSGLLALVAAFFEPLFALMGLPGESALVFVTGALLNVYSAIAVIETLGLGGRAVTILALMCLVAHNLPVETTVQRKTGSSVRAILVTRLLAAFVGAWVLNLLLPGEAEIAASISLPQEGLAWWPAALDWARGMARLCVKIVVLISGLMILQRVLEEFGVTRLLGRWMRLPLRLFGLPGDTAFLWIVANVLGLAYGSGVLMDHVSRGRLSRSNADLLNYHIAISHSLLEDTLLFVAIGVSAWWIVLPRLVLAGVAVWLRRLWLLFWPPREKAQL